MKVLNVGRSIVESINAACMKLSPDLWTKLLTKKGFYTTEDLGRHKQEAFTMCSTCEIYMTQDSPELRYCYTMEHLGGVFLDKLFA